MSNSIACAALLLAPGCPAAFASPSPIFATWNSASGTTAAGAFDGVSFTITGLHSPGLGTENLSGNSFSANLGSASQQVLHYAEESNFSVTFATAIPVLYLYDASWRPENTVSYNFSQAIQILSGNATAAVVGGDDLAANSPNFFLNGILELTNVSGFTVSQTFSDPGAQLLDFATPSSISAVPEPGEAAFFAGLFLLLGFYFLAPRRRA